MLDPTHLVVNSPPPEHSVLASCVTDGDSRLGEIFIHVNHPAIKCASPVEVRVVLSTERKQQHLDLLQTFLALREDAAQRCREAVLSPKKTEITRPAWAVRMVEGKDRIGLKCRCFLRTEAPIITNRITQSPFTTTGLGEHRDFLAKETCTPVRKSFAGSAVEIGYEQYATLKGDQLEYFRTFNFISLGFEQRAWLKKDSAREPLCLIRVEPAVTPCDKLALDELKAKALVEPFTGHTNWCPTCKQYVALSHDGPGGINCEDHLEKIAADERKHAAKREKTLAEYCTEFKKTNNATLVAKGWVGYSPEAFDMAILLSRGSVMDDAVCQFETKHARRLNKWRVQ